MRPRRAERVERVEVEVPEDLRHQDRGRALAVRRQLDELVAAIAAGDRLDIGAGGRREVVERVRAAERPERLDHVLGHLALVEPVAPVAGDPAQHLRLARRPEHLPRLRGDAVEQEVTARRAAQVLPGQPPVLRRARRHRHARLGIGDRRRQARGEPEPPPVGREPHEGVDRARHRHRRRRVHRHHRVPGSAQRLRVEPRRRPPRAVQPDQPLLAGGLQEHEGVAAEAAHRRLAEAEQHRRRDRRVDRVAAVLQDADRRLRPPAGARRRTCRSAA